MKKIALLTSGGDAPGMNAAIRAVVLTALRHKLQIVGFYHGYNGLIANEFCHLEEADVRHIIHLGGTILKSARCLEFKSPEGVQKAAKTLIEHEIDALVVIGGDGSFRGAMSLSQYWDGKVIGVPGTIDNDIDGTDSTIGFSTATETAISAIDKIRDTADAFERIFIVEVMGRKSSYLALNSGLACGAEQIITFENEQSQNFQTITSHIKKTIQHRGKSSYIIVIPENLWPGGSKNLADQIKHAVGLDCHLSILGYIQRGGNPVSQDRILATKLGVAAVEACLSGKHNKMAGERNGTIVLTDLSEVVQQNKAPDTFASHAQAEIFDALLYD